MMITVWVSGSGWCGRITGCAVTRLIYSAHTELVRLIHGQVGCCVRRLGQREVIQFYLTHERRAKIEKT